MRVPELSTVAASWWAHRNGSSIPAPAPWRWRSPSSARGPTSPTGCWNDAAARAGTTTPPPASLPHHSPNSHRATPAAASLSPPGPKVPDRAATSLKS
jgi:hypothetical protein